MDHILYWNAVALEANRRDFTDVPTGQTKPMPEQGGPTLSSRALAIVHLAMYDAHAGVVGGANLPPYLAPAPPLVPGSSAAAAVAMAAYTTLKNLYPRQQSQFDAAMVGAQLSGAGVADGMAFGQAVAGAILADRGADPGAGAAGYTPSNAPFRHRPDPVNAGQGFHAPFYGKMSKCFAVQVRQSLDSPFAAPNQYPASVKQVLAKGIAPDLAASVSASDRRTPEETLTAFFWAYDGPRNLGTPPRFFNQIVRQVAMEKGNSVDDNARLFALVNAAMGDAGILAWQEKYKWDLWRPVVGIREHDPSMGPSAPVPGSSLDDHCDPEWRPLGAPASNLPVNSTERDFTPPFPAYPSGHATFGAAALHMTRLFYGTPVGDRKKDTHITGPVVSDECNGITADSKGVVRTRHARLFSKGLWQMIVENGLSRVFLGVHWSLDAFALKANGEPDWTRDMLGGAPLGLRIAEDMWQFGNKKGPKKSAV